MNEQEIAHELSQPNAQELLTSATLARLAYNGSDGFPRVIPIGFYWNGTHIVICTATTSPKVRAISARPNVAVTIDVGDTPDQAKAVLIRGVATVDIVDGVPEEFLVGSTKILKAEQAAEFERHSLRDRLCGRIARCLSRHRNLTSAALSSSEMRCWQGFPFMRRSGRTTTSRTLASHCSSCSRFWLRACPPLRGDVLTGRRRRSRPFANGWRDGWSTSRPRRRGFDALSQGLKRSAPARLGEVEVGRRSVNVTGGWRQCFRVKASSERDGRIVYGGGSGRNRLGSCER